MQSGSQRPRGIVPAPGVGSGVADPAMTQYYLDINIPAHAGFAAIYLAAMALLLAIPLLELRRRAK